MKNYLKKSSIIFCTVLSILVVIHYLRNEQITNDIVGSFILVSLLSSIMSFMLKDDERWSSTKIIIMQVSYLSLIMISIIFITILSNWEYNINTILANFIVVLTIYMLLKYFLFQKNKQESADINIALKKRKE